MADLEPAAPVDAVPTTQSVQPEVQKYLEAVFAVAPFPEEYVRYRLHLATALPLEAIDAWFAKRRCTAHEHEETASKRPEGIGAALVRSRVEEPEPRSPHFQLFAPSTAQRSNPQQTSSLPGRATAEVVDVGRALAMMQNAGQGNGIREPTAVAAHKGSPRPLDTLDPQLPASMRSGLAEAPERPRSAANGVANGHSHPAAKASRAASEEGPPATGSRFTEADLGMVSALVGLETISSTEEHCGSRSLYMFEQLTALDSLELEGSQAAKRRRTRHQHFWRNTDKLDPDERVYVPTSCIKPAIKKKRPVMSKSEISPEERTNAWTVCLTTRGVIGYLNKRISPLGVRIIRALQNGDSGHSSTRLPLWRPAKGSPSAVSLDDDADDDGSLGMGARPRRSKAGRTAAEDFAWDARQDPLYRPRSSIAGPRLSSQDSGEDSEQDSPVRRKQLRQQLQPGSASDMKPRHNESRFEPIPRARKRKPG